MKIKSLFNEIIRYICDYCAKEIIESRCVLGNYDLHPKCLKKFLAKVAKQK